MVPIVQKKIETVFFMRLAVKLRGKLVLLDEFTVGLRCCNFAFCWFPPWEPKTPQQS